MRKLLITLFLILLVILAYFMATNGFSFFGIKILSIYEIKEDNEELDIQMARLEEITTKDYLSAQKELSDNTKELLNKKEEYTDLVAYSSNEDVDAASKLQEYEMEYLWGRFGRYATKNGIKLKLVLKTGSASGKYDIEFTATGSYVGITEFISAIENDTSFSFKIEDFILMPHTGSEVLGATFTIKDVTINNINSMNASTPTTTDNVDSSTSQENS